MKKRFFLIFAGAALFADPPGDWQRQYHQKLYDYYNIQLNEAEYLLKQAQGLTTMTGNWNGARTWLGEKGVVVSASYVTDMVGNPYGGQARGFAYAGSLGVGVGVDFGQAAGWEGFTFYGSVVWRTGTNLSQRKINNQFVVQQVYGSQTVKLNELFVQQSIRNNLFVIKTGRLDAGNDFLASPLYAEYVNNGFDGNPVGVFYNFPSFTAYPNATWGAYLSFCPINSLVFKFGCYNANSNISKNRYHGTNFTFSSTNGVIWITEWDAILNQEPGSRGMPGNYKLGFFYQTGSAQEFKDGPVNGNYCAYVLVDQMVYRPGGPGTDRGLTPFAALLFFPKDKNPFPFFCTAGVVYKGIVPSRPRDSANIGVAYGSYSSDMREVQRMAKNEGLLGPYGNRPQSYEAVLEANYWFQVNDWFTFTPDVQFVINPKGYGDIPNALVIGAQIGFVL